MSSRSALPSYPETADAAALRLASGIGPGEPPDGVENLRCEAPQAHFWGREAAESTGEPLGEPAAAKRPSSGRPPTSNTGVVDPEPWRVARDFALNSKSADISAPYGWDWSATTHEAYDGVVDDLLKALGARHVTLGKGLQGWSQSVVGHDAGGYKVGAVYFGGGRDDVHVLSSSHQAHDARESVVGIGSAKTARVDTRVDTLVPFEDLAFLCQSAAGRKARLTYVESREAGESLGRTVYVGAPTSAVRVRLYEKWRESPGLYVEGTNRVEVQLRPPSRAKQAVSGWSPAETFCASQLTRRLATELGVEVAHPGSLEKSRGTPDLERTLEAMGEQYGPAVERWLAVSGGDIGKVFDYLEKKR